jgi:putative transposase
MKERMRFVTDWERALYSRAELCERYGVSRKTGYKWIARYEREGPDGLGERSRAPHHCPHRIAADVAAAICAGRRQHPSRGPDKILHWLKRRHPELALPATSTAGDLLARRGLVKKRRRRRHYTHPGVVPPTTERPNDLWTADFKGHFRTRDGLYCYPLTVADQHTRYLLGCHRPPLDPGPGRPARLRSPLSRVRAAAGHSHRQRCAVRHHRHPRPLAAQRVVDPAGPAAPADPARQSPAERGPRADASDPQGGDRAAPQGAPACSATRLQPIPRPLQRRAPAPVSRGPDARLALPALAPRYTGGLPPIEYPGHYIPKRVTNAGTIRFKKRLIFIATSLKQHVLGLEEIDDGIWSLYFCHVLLTRIDERDYILRAWRTRGRFQGVPRYGLAPHRRSTGQRAMRHHPASASTPPHEALTGSFTKCYLCSRFILLPIFPVAHVRVVSRRS